MPTVAAGPSPAETTFPKEWLLKNGRLGSFAAGGGMTPQAEVWNIPEGTTTSESAQETSARIYKDMLTTDLSRRGFIGVGAAGLTFVSAQAVAKSGVISSDIDPSALKKSKTTPLGLYLSPRAAFEAMQGNPEIL
ncbi:MAG: hypothetical protein AAF982_13375, partial [Pseudomonadota bacterium]